MGCEFSRGGFVVPGWDSAGGTTVPLAPLQVAERQGLDTKESSVLSRVGSLATSVCGSLRSSSPAVGEKRGAGEPWSASERQEGRGSGIGTSVPLAELEVAAAKR